MDNKSVASTYGEAPVSINVRPLSVQIGAEVEGVDLRQPLSVQTVEEIRKALLVWKVVFFRDQHIEHSHHVEFARNFGRLTLGHPVFGHDQTYPEIYSVAKYRVANQYTRSFSRLWSGWHADITSAINPPAASILRGDIVPPYGGDTQWTNLAAAYQSLSPIFQEMLHRLRGIHRYDDAKDEEQTDEYKQILRDRPMVSEHPIVTVHPETAERILYVSPGFLRSIAGLTARESDQILELLWEHVVRPEFTVRFKWEPGSIAFWDNRSTLHLAPTDIFSTDFDRRFYRVTLLGDIPIGVDGKQSRVIEGKPIQAV